MAFSGSCRQRVEAGIDALRSERYRDTKSARLAERALLQQSGVLEDIAVHEVQLPKVERCHRGPAMRVWLDASLLETISAWRLAGLTTFCVHWYRDWEVCPSYQLNWAMLVEWEPGRSTRMLTWPSRLTPFVIDTHKKLQLHCKKGIILTETDQHARLVALGELIRGDLLAGRLMSEKWRGIVETVTENKLRLGSLEV